MPFDGVEYQQVPLIGPYNHVPGAPVLPQLTALGLMAAYAYCRGHANLIGVQTHTGSLSRPSDYQVVGTTWQGVAAFNGYVPSWATHIIADMSFYSTANTSAEVHMHVATTAETGADFEIPYSPAEPTRTDHNPFGPVERGLAVLALSATTLGQDVDVYVRAYAAESEAAQAAVLRPHVTSAWWVSVG